MIEIILPTDERLTISKENITSLPNLISLSFNINICNQKFFMNDNFIKLEDILDNLTIYLVINCGKKYIICSKSIEKKIIDLEFITFVAPKSYINNRDINNLKKSLTRYYDSNYIYYKKDSLKVTHIEIANKHLNIYYEYKKIRLEEINKICNSMKTNTYVISTFNKPYIVLFKNWILSCDKNNIEIRDKAIMFPMDEESHKACLDLNIKSFFMKGSYGPTTKIHLAYGEKNFAICMFMKNAIIQDMLSLKKNILFQDIDMVWLNDPITKLEKISNIKKYDFMFMYDGENPRFQPLYYNSGFIFIKYNEFSAFTWEKFFKDYYVIWYYKSQQAPLNMLLGRLEEKGLRIYRLDEFEFLNGHLIRPDNKSLKNIKDHTYVIHVSWTGNLEFKLKKLRENNLWFID